MSRILPLLAWQVPARDPEVGLHELRDHLGELLQDFPATRLVVLPEYHVCAVHGPPGERARRYRELAEPLDGPRVQALRGLAADLGIWLVPGTFPEAGDHGELFNTTVLLGPDGDVHATYRKIFPWRPFEPFDMGTEFTVAEIPGVGRVGFAICYDLWFPEVIRQLAWLGADLVVIPTQTSTRDREQEIVLARAAAIANQVFVLSLNAATPSGVGQSLLVDPEGRVRFQAPSEVAGVYTDVLDLDEVTRVREYGTSAVSRMWHYFEDGDPEIPLPAYRGAIRPTAWPPGVAGPGPGHPVRTTPADPAADGTHLERPLTLLPLVLFGIAYVTPFIVLTTFGVFSQASHGTLATAPRWDQRERLVAGAARFAAAIASSSSGWYRSSMRRAVASSRPASTPYVNVS